MLRLLRREEKNHLRSQLLDNNLIFKAFQAPVREYEIKHTKGYHMSPEEVFWSVVIKLDYIKEHQKDAMQDIRSLWNDVYMDYHDLSSDDNDETVSLFASLTVFALQVCLLKIDVPLYRQMALNLASQLALHNQPTKDMEASVLNNIAHIVEDKFTGAITDYMASEDEWLSDEIEEVLKSVTHVETITAVEEKGDGVEQLTIRQLIILFEELFKVSLTSSETNISALARLIEKVSGYKQSSIRTSIRDVASKGYDSPSIKNDISVLVSIIEKIKPDFAEKLKII